MLVSKVPNFLFLNQGEYIMDISTKLAYRQGMLPDRYWYQLNERSTTENYIEQRLEIPDDDEEVFIKSEVRVT